MALMYEEGFDTMKWQAYVPPPDDGSCPSNLARFFANLYDSADRELRTDAALSDVVDSALRSLHQVSQRHKPSPQALLEGVAPASRQEMLVWLVQAFEVMHFSDNLLYETALLLDRYYASQPPPEDGIGGAQRKLLAAVCTSLKIGAPIEQLQLPLREVVTHLGRAQVPFDAVLVAELAMLRQLRFQVGTPTAKEFLEALATRLDIASACNSLAEFLLQLTLIDVPLHYRHPHAILAASALALALHTTRAPHETYVALLEDLALHCPADVHNHQHLLVQCSSALHALWTHSVGSHSQPSMYAQELCKKFSRASHHRASSVVPPTFSLSSVPPAQSWGLPLGSPAAQEELDEAITLVNKSLANDDPRWANTLGERLRSLADNSWKLRWVLARHGWNSGRFRVTPDREQLLRDLMRNSRGPKLNEKGRLTPSTPCSGGEKGRVSSASSKPRSPASNASTTASGDAPVSFGSAQKQDRRLRRAASWCGQRSGTRDQPIIRVSLPLRSP
jgi:hypothetical protein